MVKESEDFKDNNKSERKCARVGEDNYDAKSCKSGLLLCVSFPWSLSLIFYFKFFFVNLFSIYSNILCDKVHEL